MRQLPVVLAFLLSVLPFAAKADFIPTPGAVTNCAFGTDSWAWDHAEGSNVIDTDFWRRVISADAVGGNETTLHLNVTHKRFPEPCHEGEDNSHLETVDLKIPSIRTPGFYRRVQEFKHERHFDIIRLSAEISGTTLRDSTVTASGRHEGMIEPAWSYFAEKPGKLTVEATFPDRDPKTLVEDLQVEKGPVFKNESLTKRRLPDGARDWDYTFTGSPTAHMELAFLGAVDGIPGKLDLAPAFDFFEQTVGPIQAPFFESETQELFVFVDLSQWLLSMQLFQPFEQVSIVDGLSDMLPGFFFSTSPILAVGDQVLQQSGYTGQVLRVGMVDGETIPEPATVFLWSAAVLGLLGCRRERRSRRDAS